jgi:polysaccharide deacetylase family protein (PEP-CTERM system associated)
MKNAITIDLEDYYQVSAFAQDVSVSHWDSFVSRVENNTARMLSILDDLSAKATFFTLGWVARKYPKLVREIADRGHEIACHSDIHRLVFSLSPKEFRDDTFHAKDVLEDVVGVPVRGYRAPSFSITRRSLWAFEVLAELGFTYDSSLFPIRHPNYGAPNAPRFPFAVATPSGTIIEFPMPTLQMKGMKAPIGGGAYLRLLPYWYTRWGIRYLNIVENRPACIYLHPWELDPEQPRMNGSTTARMRHRIGLQDTESKFRRLLGDFHFDSLGELTEELIGPSSAGSKLLPEIPVDELNSFFSAE